MAGKLEKYRSKRNFEITAEPSGARNSERKKNKKLKFVVQYHTARRTHYDFRLEWEGVLLSWAVPKGPSYNPADKRLAVMVEDHPLEYAAFEGYIPKGEYGGGSVMLWDEGSWEPRENFAEGLKVGSIKFKLNGKRLKGGWALVRMKEESNSKNWLLIKEKDEFVRGDDGISQFTSSVRTGRSAEQIAAQEDKSARKNPKDKFGVQLAAFSDRPPDGNDWFFEVKYDGYRILAFVEGGRAALITRNGHDFTDKFRTVAAELEKFSSGRAMILDGEMAVADETGRTDFQALQNYIKNPRGQSASYMVFDLLALDGEDLRELKLSDRKNRLEELMKDAPECLKFSKYVVGKGSQCLEAAAKLGLEGIVGKRADSLYRAERSGDWIKVKCYRRQEFVIGGYSVTDKNVRQVSALLLGYYSGDNFVYAGRAGTGMGVKEAEELKKRFEKSVCAAPPFTEAPKARAGELIHWLKPQFVAEIQFAEWTDEGSLRQASFKGLREDKNPREAVLESEITPESDVPGSAEKLAAEKPLALKTKKDSAKARKPESESKKSAVEERDGEIYVSGVRISSPDKIMFKNPEITKLDLVEYYRAVSRRMLPLAEGRILSVVRCHKGVNAACFFKKHPTAEGEGIAVIPVENSEGESSDYFYIESEKGLISEAQAGTVEFHVWGSKAQNLEMPDMMVFDLDPDEGMALEQVRRGVRDLKNVLDKLSLKCFLKTSGGKGYHVVVPFAPGAGWEAFHDFARQIALLMEKKWPDRYTANMRKSNRKSRIFIDWARNGRGATSVAPYSLRARPGAKVSMPISWRELNAVAPDGIDIYGALDRIKKPDPWKDFHRSAVKLEI